MRHILIILFVALSLLSCRSVRYVPVESVKHDSIYVNRVQHDSIYQQDSIYIRDKGDTVYIDRYKYKYIYKNINDTIYVEHNDTIQVVVEVEKKLTRWQSLKMNIGGYAMAFLVLAFLSVVGWAAYKLIRKQ